MSKSSLDFHWDLQKARRNVAKHGVAFDEAMTVFADPLAMSLFDEDHSRDEERWITMGAARSGRMVVVVRTFEESADRARIRLISARLATRRQGLQYREG